MSENYEKKVADETEGLDFATTQFEIVFETSMGSFTLSLDSAKAPGHCRNMVGLAKAGFYNGLIFHRIIDGFMIQGGCPDGNGMGGPGYNVDAEFNDTPHKAGVLSMARSQDPNSAGSQFFVCVADAPFLDGQYTAFGATKDAESLEVVKKIGLVKTGSGDLPIEDVIMKSATVLQV